MKRKESVLFYCPLMVNRAWNVNSENFIFIAVALDKEEKCVLQLTATVRPAEVSFELEMLKLQGCCYIMCVANPIKERGLC